MSDIPPAIPTEAMPVAENPPPTFPPSPISDSEVPALIEQLRPVLAAIVNAGVAAALEATPVPSFRLGTARRYDMTTDSLSVELDSETSTIDAQVVGQIPVPGQRVLWMNVPPSNSWVIGIVGRDGGFPSGFVCWFAGDITSDGGGSGATTAPLGWLRAYGQAVSRADYPLLFGRVGTNYGSGDGQTTFNLPDLRGRFLGGLDNAGGGGSASDAGRLSAANVIGTTGGAESITLSTTNLPSHDHTFTPSGSVSISAVSGTVSVSGSISETDFVRYYGSGSAYLLQGAQGLSVYGPYNTGGATFSGSGSFSFTSGTGSFSGNAGTTGTRGSGTAITTLPPYALGIWCIKA